MILKSYFKQIPVPFKINADFEYNLKSVESMKVFSLKKYQDHVRCSFANKLVCFDRKFTKPIVVFRGENVAYKVIEAILKEFEYCRRVMTKHFNKSLIMSEKQKEQFQSSSICWICKNFIDDGDEKVRDHCHVT